MDNNDVFSELDTADKTIVKPATRPLPKKTDSRHDTESIHLGIDAVDTISSIRESSVNPLVAAAAPILSLLQRIQSTLDYKNINDLHQRLVLEIQNYETSAQGKLLDRQTILVGRYVLCAVLDEVILTTPWGNNSAWASHSLLSTFHKETSAGQKFFIIVDRLLQDASQNLHTLELISICLLLGFKGKYRIDPEGEHKLKHIRNDLINRIEILRKIEPSHLSPHWKGEITQSSKPKMAIPIWVLAAITGTVMLAVYSAFNLGLSNKATPVISDIERIGKPSIETEHRL